MKDVGAMKWRIILGLTLCAFLLTPTSVWADSWNSSTGTLIIDVSLKSLDRSSSPPKGGLQQAVEALTAKPKSDDIKELIIKPSAAPGGSSSTGGVLLWEDMWYIATGQNDEANVEIKGGMLNIVSIDCTGAKGEAFDGHISKGIGKYLTKLKFLSLPEGIQEIRTGAFQNTAIETIILPESLKRISEDVFPPATTFKTIVFMGATPPTIENGAFDGSSYNSTNRLRILIPKAVDQNAWREALEASGLNAGKMQVEILEVTDIAANPSGPLDSSGGRVKVTVTGTEFTEEMTILVVLDNKFPGTEAEIISATQASADIVIPENTGTTVVSHELTVFLNGYEVEDVSAIVEVNSAQETPLYVPLASVDLAETLSVTKGSAPKTLTATLKPANTTSKDVTVKWDSLDPSIVKVTPGSGTGITRTATIEGLAVTASEKPVTVSFEIPGTDIYEECKVTVTEETAPKDPTPQPESVQFTTPKLRIPVGQTAPLGWVISPTGATPDVRLDSDNPSVAAVSPSTTTGTAATVTGLIAGEATITVTTVDGGKTDKCEVTVAPTTGTSGIISRITLSEEARVGDPFDIKVALTSAPHSVKIDILRPDWGTDSNLVARMEGLLAWISYTPPQEGTYTVNATAFTDTGVVSGTGAISFVVSGGRGSGGGSGSGGGCSAVGMGLLALFLLPAFKRIKKGK